MRTRIALWLGVLGVAAAGLAWLATELVMAPDGAERQRLVAMFAALAIGSVVVGLALYQATRRRLNRRILITALAGPAIVSGATIVGARSMFISTHDTQFVIILISLAAALAASVVTTLAQPLVSDLDELRSVAERLGAGDLSARAGLDRSDEVGDLAQSIDAMARRISDAQQQRDAAERERSVMLASLSHDARTPLSAMRAALEAVQDGLSPDPERYLASIGYELEAVERIVDNIFVLGQLEAGRLAPTIATIDLVELANRCCASLAPLAEQNQVTIAVRAPAVCAARGADSEAYRVIQNLVGNAIRHSPPNGTVTVEILCEATPTLVVIDEGPGFDPSFVADAFQAFTRAEQARERSHGGAGLGLAVSKGIIDALDGQIWADAGPGGRVGFKLQPAIDAGRTTQASPT